MALTNLRASPHPQQRPVDPQALLRGMRRLLVAAEPPWLHGEVAGRMAQRLALIKQRPQRVLNWWAPLAGGAAVLQAACPGARVVPVWPAFAADLLPQPRRSWLPWRHAEAIVLDSQTLPRSAQLLWCNMGLHHAPDPLQLFARWRELIEVDGFLMFSTLGPGTLTQIRALYDRLALGPPMAELTDMHDLGDMLVQTGFADPVMDQETLTLTWADPGKLLAELNGLGNNAHPGRMPGLRTPRWHSHLLKGLEDLRNAHGQIAMDFEVVYGHAFCPLRKPRVAQQTMIAAEDLRALARSPRPGS